MEYSMSQPKIQNKVSLIQPESLNQKRTREFFRDNKDHNFQQVLKCKYVYEHIIDIADKNQVDIRHEIPAQSQISFHRKEGKYVRCSRLNEWKVHLMFDNTKENAVSVLTTLIENQEKLPLFYFKYLPIYHYYEIFPEPFQDEKVDQLPRYKYNGKWTQSEIIFPPIICFYVNPEDVEQLTTVLLELFPDDMTRHMTKPHYYTRFNLKLNNMIYFITSGANLRDISYTCNQCTQANTPDTCSLLNNFSMNVADKELCKWNNGCEINPIRTPELLLYNHKMIRNVYQIIGKEAIYIGFLNEYKQKFDSLPHSLSHRELKRFSKRFNKRFSKQSEPERIYDLFEGKSRFHSKKKVNKKMKVSSKNKKMKNYKLKK